MDTNKFPLEYVYRPSSDSEERLAQAWELILALILADHQIEQKQVPGETC
ncbi:MAG: hypothetical protein HND51_02630 [Chloroflexi bacterium]|nr:hypothetical protein [Chloroflexota bacterium]